MFLIAIRILKDIRKSFEFFTKYLKENPKNEELQNLVFMIDANLNKAQSKFKVYDIMLEDHRNKISSKISRIFVKDSVDGKERFLDGFEGLDFTKE